MFNELLLILTNYLQLPSVEKLFLVLYAIGATLITLYSLGQFHLLFIYLKKRKTYKRVCPRYSEGDHPYVTVQIPMFNELYVAQHVIDACAKLEWPKNKLEIQVLDDSTDETLQISQKRAEYWQQRGIDVVVVHRDNREGFKAGALKEGTKVAKGEFIAIFDADFRPHADFLTKTIGYFQDPKVGVVQGRWGHLNRSYSLLTRAQSLLHDFFFIIEQQAREIGGFFLRFNGSAGVWRKETIWDAGDWSGDTLSEDYDLCLRAQLKDWKIVYDIDVDAPAELPVSMLDFKAQQYRWTKGRGQIIKKLFTTLVKAKLEPMVKFHVIFDLLGVFILLGILLLAISSIPIVLLLPESELVRDVLIYFSISLINVAIAPWFAWIVMKYYEKTFWSRLKEMGKTFFPFVVLIIGMPLFQMVSLIDGFLNKKSFFHRTSKYNVIDKSDHWRDKMYTPTEVPLFTWGEGVLALFFFFGLFVDIKLYSIGFVPFHLLLSVGYTYVFVQSFRKV